MSQTNQLEFRTASGDIETSDEGIFSGYIVTWNNVDDYNSRFSPGAFADSISKRSSKIKVLYDHQELIGTNVEMREDATGVFVTGKLNMEVRRAREVFSFIKDKTLEGLSFAFRTIADHYEKGVRVIDKLDVYEYGPVIFPASSQALITEAREANFAENLAEMQLRDERYQMLSALTDGLDEIHWGNEPDPIGMADLLITDFHAAYLDWMKRAMEAQASERSMFRGTPLQNAIIDQLQTESKKDLLQRTGLTDAELRAAMRGEMIDKIATISDAAAAAYKEHRNRKVEDLCFELRGRLSEFEAKRVEILLSQRKQEDFSPVLRELAELKLSFN